MHHPKSAQPEHSPGARAVGGYVIKPYHRESITLTPAFALLCLVQPQVKYDTDTYYELLQSNDTREHQPKRAFVDVHRLHVSRAYP